MTGFLEETITVLFADTMLYLFLTLHFVRISVYRISIREVILLFHSNTNKYSNLLSLHQLVNLVPRMPLMGR